MKRSSRDDGLAKAAPVAGRIIGLRSLMPLALTALALSLGSVVVDAQTAPIADEGPELQEVVVTGSLIKRNDFETPSPVQVITSDQLTQSGYTSVAQVLSTLAANGQGSLSQGFEGSFAAGASGIALRGLSVGATLTLIDGERMVAYPLTDDGQRSFVDTSSIPMLAVDRIEVLKDGASSEYGSDAMAGVVNVILKKTYTGAEFSAEGGETIHGDGATERLTGIAGFGDLDSDGYNGWISVEWRHQDEIYEDSRNGAWTRLNWIPYGGTNEAFGAGSLFTSTGSYPFEAGSGPYYVPGSASSYQSPGVTFTSAACPSAAAMAADQCTVNESRLQIQPQTGNLNVLGRFTIKLGGNWQEVTTASLFRSEAEQIADYEVTDPPAPGIAPGTPIQYAIYGPGYVTVSSPITLTMPNGTYPVANLYEFGQPTTQLVTDTYRVFFDFSGKEGGWDLDADAGIMYALTEEDYTNFVNYGALQTALSNGYVLGSGGAKVADVASPVDSEMSNSLQVIDLRATRSLLTLPGGPLSLGLGAGYNHRYLDATESPAAAAYDDINLSYAYGGQTDVSTYAELDAPLIKGLDIDSAVRYDHYDNTGGTTVPKFGVKYAPIDQITFRGTFGKGFRAPNPAEYSHAASAFVLGNYADPQLCPSQAGTVASSGYSQYNLALPTTSPVAGDVAYYCNFPAVQLQTTNPNLRPERSTNYTFGAIFQPIRQASLSVDFWNIVINDPIITNSEFPALPLPPSPTTNVRTGPVSLPVLQPNGSYLNQIFAEGEPIYSDTTYENAGKIHVDGIDFDLAGHFDLGDFGTFSPQLNWTKEIVWNISSCYEGDCAMVHLAGTHGPTGISGDTGNPKDRGVLTLDWDRGPLNVTATVSYVGPYDLTDPSVDVDTCAEAIAGATNSAKFLNGYVPAQYCVVKAFTEVNLFARYSISKKLDVFGSIQNLFNSAPPVDLQTYAAGLMGYNPSMAQDGAVGMLISAGFKIKM